MEGFQLQHYGSTRMKETSTARTKKEICACRAESDHLLLALRDALMFMSECLTASKCPSVLISEQVLTADFKYYYVFKASAI